MAGARRALRGDHGRPPCRRDRDGRRLAYRHRRHPRDHRGGRATSRRSRATRSTSSTKCTCCRTQAFNGLLKTLEEPPEHVKFVFATTEIRKVPVTVLSRCQRFDLRRIEADRLVGLLRGIAAKEDVEVERRRAGHDRPRRRGLGARFALAPRPGDRPLRRRRRRRPRRCGRCSASPTAAGSSTSSRR